MSNLKKLKKKFFHKKTLELAPNLLGKYLVRKKGGAILIGKITETEAYYGPNDLASHASRGRTKRTEIMFKEPGLAYIYLIYGMYYCFNISAEKKDFPAAVLIRAIEPVAGIQQMAKNRQIKINHQQLSTLNFKLLTSIANGPGKLCQAFKIDKTLSAENLITSPKLYLAENSQEKIKPSQIVKTKRIGIDYAGKYKNKPWRFYLKNSPFISKK
ncbi:MAG TPA: DNA-3-methyladenine glycosylase [Candidatus Uhrbacteria bacterium]|nr:DNA-3-methyladenine glycosylase [Candidatus Uhrbacteria bacterium]